MLIDVILYREEVIIIQDGILLLIRQQYMRSDGAHLPLWVLNNPQKYGPQLNLNLN